MEPYWTFSCVTFFLIMFLRFLHGGVCNFFLREWIISFHHKKINEVIVVSKRKTSYLHFKNMYAGGVLK